MYDSQRTTLVSHLVQVPVGVGVAVCEEVAERVWDGVTVGDCDGVAEGL